MAVKKKSTRKTSSKVKTSTGMKCMSTAEFQKMMKQLKAATAALGAAQKALTATAKAMSKAPTVKPVAKKAAAKKTATKKTAARKKTARKAAPKKTAARKTTFAARRKPFVPISGSEEARA